MSQGNSGNDGGGGGGGMPQVECPAEDCDGQIRPAGGMSNITPTQIVQFLLEDNQTVKIVPLECNQCDWTENKTITLRGPSFRNT